ncbi:MAG TPA: polysaccharide ABC transporter ATP-binding protein [Clostridia bacterium]|nr:polysaccharide ABC transporter ATP-binding protein [Clostridia bacterium]
MADKAIVIKVEHIGKKYVIGHRPEKLPRSSGMREQALQYFQRQSKEDFWALSDINLTIKQGERVGIIGKNGAGKSTLLKLLSRITEPTRGRIELLGKTASMLEVGTGFNPELTGRENVYLNGAILGMAKTEIDAKFDQIVAFSEIGNFIDTPVKRYSSGMYVRLAFSVASHLEPDILIIDEVLAVGDQKFRRKCMDRMNAIAQSNKTILCVSHQMNVIRELCDRVLVLQGGQLVFDGETGEGIRFYLDESEQNGNGYFDLKSAQRASVSTKQARLESLEISDDIKRLTGECSAINFKLKWSCAIPVCGVKLRMIVRFNDDSPVGIALSQPLCDASAGATYAQTLRFDTAKLFPGSYKASLALYESDAGGKSVILDHITDAIAFEVPELKGADKSLIYNHTFWGHVRLDDLISID